MSEERLYQIKRRWVPIYLLLFLAMVIVTVHLVLMYVNTGSDSYMNFLIISGLFTAYIFYSLVRLYRIRIVAYDYFEEIRCTSCDYKEIVRARKGDYIYKELGRCGKCGEGTLFVAGIFREERRR